MLIRTSSSRDFWKAFFRVAGRQRQRSRRWHCFCVQRRPVPSLGRPSTWTGERSSTRPIPEAAKARQHQATLASSLTCPVRAPRIATPASMIGETISHYRITDKLGAGGMGIVYKARDLQLERFVALRFLPQDLSLSETDRERFLREARSASALYHPNIRVIHGIDKTDDGRMFVVRAHYQGQTLSQKLSAVPL